MFRKAYKAGRHKSAESMTVFVMKDRAAAALKKKHPEKKTITRVGITASKKVGGAVQRNRAKRVVREAYRRIDKTYGIKKGWLVVISCRPQCAEVKTDKASSQLYFCLNSLDMLENKQPQQPQQPLKPPPQDLESAHEAHE